MCVCVDVVAQADWLWLTDLTDWLIDQLLLQLDSPSCWAKVQKITRAARKKKTQTNGGTWDTSRDVTKDMREDGDRWWRWIKWERENGSIRDELEKDDDPRGGWLEGLSTGEEMERKKLGRKTSNIDGSGQKKKVIFQPRLNINLYCQTVRFYMPML